MKAVADCDGFLFVLYSPLINAYLCLTKDEDMDEILQWLTNGKDYQTGITLLERHQRNRMLVQHFRHSTPKFAAAKLEYELRKLLKGKSVAANQTSFPRSAMPVPASMNCISTSRLKICSKAGRTVSFSPNAGV